MTHPFYLLPDRMPWSSVAPTLLFHKEHQNIIKRRGAYSFYLGCVQGVKLPQREGESFYGVADPRRRDGTARGPNII